MTRRSVAPTAPPAAPGPASPDVIRPAMPLDELDRWLREPRPLRPVANTFAMLDGYVTAIVAGPVSYAPLAWLCPLLGVPPEAHHDGDTAEFAAMKAVVERHNAISDTLADAPARFAPIFARSPAGAVDVAPWCRGFHAAMQLRPKAWRRLLPTGRPAHLWLQPILVHCGDAAGRPVPGAPPPGPLGDAARFEADQRIPLVVEAMRQFWMPIRYKTRR